MSDTGLFHIQNPKSVLTCLLSDCPHLHLGQALPERRWTPLINWSLENCFKRSPLYAVTLSILPFTAQIITVIQPVNSGAPSHLNAPPPPWLSIAWLLTHSASSMGDTSYKNPTFGLNPTHLSCTEGTVTLLLKCFLKKSGRMHQSIACCLRLFWTSQVRVIYSVSPPPSFCFFLYKEEY